MKPEEIKGAVKTRGKLPAKSRCGMGDIRLWLYLSYAAVWFDFGFEIRRISGPNMSVFTAGNVLCCEYRNAGTGKPVFPPSTAIPSFLSAMKKKTFSSTTFASDYPAGIESASSFSLLSS